MIIKINFTEHYDGGLTINKVLKIKPEKVAPLFGYITWFPFARIYRKVDLAVNNGNDNVRGVQYVYLFNTEIKPNFHETSDNYKMYYYLLNLAKGYIREFRINEIIE